MSVYKQVLLYCDGDGCKDEGPFNAFDPHETAAEARQAAKACGWSRRKGKDFCPACTFGERTEGES